MRGFIKADIPNTELHIYGEGDFRKELEELAKEYSSVKYMGIAPNNVIVENELKATLLVNPRPTDADYTKYSFPSKNMEYMASGTPILTTRLPGMPKDYYDYIYTIDGNSKEDITAALQKVLANSQAELLCMGKKAKAFVLENKNNVAQSARILALLED